MKHKRKHTTIDKARRLAEIISLKPSDTVAPSERSIAAILEGKSLNIGIIRRKGKTFNERIHD